jgi:hypothetical protein
MLREKALNCLRRTSGEQDGKMTRHVAHNRGALVPRKMTRIKNY